MSLLFLTLSLLFSFSFSQSRESCPYSIPLSSLEVSKAHFEVDKPYLSLQQLVASDDGDILEIKPWKKDKFEAIAVFNNPPFIQTSDITSKTLLRLNLNVWSNAKFLFYVKNSLGEWVKVSFDVPTSSSSKTIQLGLLKDYLFSNTIELKFVAKDTKSLYIDSLYFSTAYTPEQNSLQDLFTGISFSMEYDTGDYYKLFITVPEPIICYVHLRSWDGVSMTNSWETAFEAFAMEVADFNAVIRVELKPGITYLMDLDMFNNNGTIYRQYLTLSSDDLPVCSDIGTYSPISTNSSIFTQQLSASVNGTVVLSKFSTSVKGRNAFVLSEQGNPSSSFVQRAYSLSLISNHNLTYSGLQPGKNYTLQAYFKEDNGLVWYRTQVVNFSIAKVEVPVERENVALLSKGATVKTSSNWANGGPDSSFGANKAIDGSDSTEWSSNGDGNNAWIQVTLPQSVEVSGFGLFTRRMTDGSSIVKSVKITNQDNGSTIGTFSLKSEFEKEIISLDKYVTAKVFQFDVETSTGGNTGFKTVDIYKSNT